MSPKEPFKLWAVWLLGLFLLVIGVALIAYHARDIPYTWNFQGFGAILGVIGFLTLLGTTASMIESESTEFDS